MQQLSPLLSYFYEISAIPRPSYKEQKIAAYLMEFAEKNHHEAIRDETDNVLIRKPASAGYENAPVVVLQGHSDMVCEKNAATVHDFDRDGIRIIREGDILRADGTTLGADNGYAVAAMLAILSDKDAQHPELECLFTTAEETGMDGMRHFDKSLLRGRMMINLDSCEEDSATAACAGGVRTAFRRSCRAEALDASVIRLFITGLAGGHSGEDIGRGRGNALKIAARILDRAACPSLRICRMEGGSKDNAIPRECEVLVFSDELTKTAEIMKNTAALIAAELGDDDRAFSFTVEKNAFTGEAMSADDTAALISLLRILPCGPQTMSLGIPGLVESSSNTSVIRADASHADITILSRSSSESRLDDICALVENCARLCGFSAEHADRYPGWDFTVHSKIQEIYKNSSRVCLGKEGSIIGLHAGLECGLLSQEIPDMDMLSIGPNMVGIHTPAEQLSVSSAERVYQLLLHMLASIR